MVNINCLALAVVIATSAFAAPALAEPGRETFTLEFRYDEAKSAIHNYAAFLRMAERACTTPGVRSLDAQSRDNACIADVMDKFAVSAGRADIAAVHFEYTGRRIDSSRSLAAR